MPITVDKALCRGCRDCLAICPGDLLSLGEDRLARLEEPERCWGCGACLKACSRRALALSLHPALGGRGLRLTVLGEDAQGRPLAAVASGPRPIRLRWRVKGASFADELVTEPGQTNGY
jgi:NAD-dependent dihydropyrimidine dehydrogenase PreA subunit